MAEGKQKEFTIIEDADIIGKFKETFSRVVESIIGRAWGDKTKGFKVCLPVPENDEQAQELYNLSLADLIEYGVQKVSTMVDYTVVLDSDKDGKVLPEKTFLADLDDDAILARLQEAADAYKVGTRAPGKAKQDKQTLDQIGQLAIAMGFENTPEGRSATIAALKAKHGA